MCRICYFFKGVDDELESKKVAVEDQRYEVKYSRGMILSRDASDYRPPLYNHRSHTQRTWGEGLVEEPFQLSGLQIPRFNRNQWPLQYPRSLACTCGPGVPTE